MKTKRSAFRRRHNTDHNMIYRVRREERRGDSRNSRRTPADLERVKESRRVQQAKADRRSAVWNGARL